MPVDKTSVLKYYRDNANLSYAKIGEHFNLSRQRIHQILTEDEPPTPNSLRPSYTCPCGNTFYRYGSKPSKYCSTVCHNKYLILQLVCDNCKTIFSRPRGIINMYKTTGYKHSFCTHKCSTTYRKLNGK